MGLPAIGDKEQRDSGEGPGAGKSRTVRQQSNQYIPLTHLIFRQERGISLEGMTNYKMQARRVRRERNRQAPAEGSR